MPVSESARNSEVDHRAGKPNEGEDEKQTASWSDQAGLGGGASQDNALVPQNFDKFSALLQSTGDNPIVEETHRRDLWGAKADKRNPDTLVGVNALGRLLMELRRDILNAKQDELKRVDPLDIPDFNLYGEQIRVAQEGDRAKISGDWFPL